MFRCVLPLLGLVVVAALLPAQTLSDEEIKEGFISLINGKDFSGWRFSGTIPNPDKTVKAKPFTSALDVFPENWKAGDGMIQLLKGGNPDLASQWDFDDFEARLQWRAHKKSYNSGFYVRSGKSVGANQINLNAPAVGELINTVPALKGKGKGVPELHKVGGSGEWNDWRVLAVGNKLTFWVNGQQAWAVDEFVPARGYLGLQAEGTIDFRNLRVKEIGYEVFRFPKDFQGDGWSAKDDILTGNGKLATPKPYKNYTLRLEFRGQGGLQLGDTRLPFDHPDLKPVLHPEGQFNYLQVKVADGVGKLWCNTQDLKTELKVGEGPLAVVPEKGLEIRHFRVRPAVAPK
ncbi:MAG: DUF1080 domain-containing protein [Planctomycetia bacterium]|nr:DUF1080 domain-containing protein [Planctomycetia bacterium]